MLSFRSIRTLLTSGSCRRCIILWEGRIIYFATMYKIRVLGISTKFVLHVTFYFLLTHYIHCPQRPEQNSTSYIFFNCMFLPVTSCSAYCSSTQFWGRVLPSFVEKRDQNSFLTRTLFVHRGQTSYTPTAFGKLWTTPGVRCIIHASS